MHFVWELRESGYTHGSGFGYGVIKKMQLKTVIGKWSTCA